MHIVTGPAGQRVEIDALVLEAGVFIDLPSVTTATGSHLMLPVPDRVGLGVNRVAGGAIDGSFIVRAAHKLNHLHARFLFRMAIHAGRELFFPR